MNGEVLVVKSGKEGCPKYFLPNLFRAEKYTKYQANALLKVLL